MEWTVTLSWALGSPSRTCLSDSDFCLWFTNNLEIIMKHWITPRQQALFSMQWHCPQTDHAFFNFCCPSFFLLLLCLCCHCSVISTQSSPVSLPFCSHSPMILWPTPIQSLKRARVVVWIPNDATKAVISLLKLEDSLFSHCVGTLQYNLPKCNSVYSALVDVVTLALVQYWGCILFLTLR